MLKILTCLPKSSAGRCERIMRSPLKQSKNGISLALGGGGARGFAHLGVLQVFEEHDIPIKAIGGCSIGAIIGGLYAYYGRTRAVIDFLTDLIQKEEFKNLNIEVFASSKIKKNIVLEFNYTIQRYFNYYKTIRNTSMLSKKDITDIFDYFPDVKIENLDIPFFANATDLISGKEVILKTGLLKNAMRASASIPAIFPPVKRNTLLLVDGGITDLIPARVLKKRYNYPVIGVDVEQSPVRNNYFSNGLQIMWRVQEIQFHYLAHLRKKEAHLIIKPNIDQYSWADVHLMNKFIEEGRKAALSRIKTIKYLAGY